MMKRQLGVLLALACLMLVATPASAGLCFPSMLEVLANKFKPDGQTVFSVTRQDGVPLNVLKPALCPGMTYNVHIEFPEPRKYWVLGTKGFFKGLLPSLACPNQLTNVNASSEVTSLDLPFTVSCDVVGKSVWSIASLPKANPLLAKEQIIKSFLNITLPVLEIAACPASFCTNKNYTGSSGNSTIPAYGQCGGAGGECAGYYCADMPFPGYKCVSGWTCQRQHRWYYQCLPATLPISTTGCDFSAFGEPLATMMSGLGMICNLKAGIMQFALNPLAVPKLVDPSAMLNIFSGLVAMKTSAVPIDPFSLILSFKKLCEVVPTGNSTQAIMVASMSKFLTVMTSKVMPAASNSTDLSKATFDVLAALGAAAYTGSYMDLSKSFSMSDMLQVVTSFGTVLSVAKSVGLKFS